VHASQRETAHAWCVAITITIGGTDRQRLCKRVAAVYWYMIISTGMQGQTHALCPEERQLLVQVGFDVIDQLRIYW
jgi:hypothetical protein